MNTYNKMMNQRTRMNYDKWWCDECSQFHLEEIGQPKCDCPVCKTPMKLVRAGIETKGSD